MARILENKKGKRNIILTTDDVISVLKEYQSAVKGAKSYTEIRQFLNGKTFCLPEDLV